MKEFCEGDDLILKNLRLAFKGLLVSLCDLFNERNIYGTHL